MSWLIGINGTAAESGEVRTMGFTGLDAVFAASDATVTFNSKFDFYYGSGLSRAAKWISRPSHS